nr:hypothetical protein [Angustibacter aerolatus]
MRAAVDDSPDADDPAEVAAAVLGLVAAAGDALAPGDLPWLADLALPDADDDPAPAGALALPGSLAARVLDPDDIGLLHERVVDAWPREALVAVGVLDLLAVVRAADVDPADPPDEPGRRRGPGGVVRPGRRARARRGGGGARPRRRARRGVARGGACAGRRPRLAPRPGGPGAPARRRRAAAADRLVAGTTPGVGGHRGGRRRRARRAARPGTGVGARPRSCGAVGARRRRGR